MARLLLFLSLVVVIYAQNPVSYYPVMSLLDQMWGLNYTQRFGPPETACNCSYANPGAFLPCAWVDPVLIGVGFSCQYNGSVGILTGIYLLNNTFPTPSIPTEIGILTSLNILLLQSNGLQGQIPDSLGQITDLKRVLLNDNLLTGPVPTTLNQLIKLELIDFSNNELNGTLPTLDAILPSTLLTLKFSSNEFTGPVPSTWAGFNGLSYLDVSSNKITGNLNAFLSANFSSLVGLNISHNQIDGVLPASLISSVLSILDISYNSFVDPLPDLSNASVIDGTCRLEYNKFSLCQTQPRPECSIACLQTCPPPIPIFGAVCNPITGQWQVTELNFTSGTVVITGNLTIVGNVSLSSQSVLVLGNGSSITVTDTIRLDGTLQIQVGQLDNRTVITAGTIVGNFSTVITDQKCVKAKSVQTAQTLNVLLVTVDKCNKKNLRTFRIILGATLGAGVLLLTILIIIFAYFMKNASCRLWFRGESKLVSYIK